MSEEEVFNNLKKDFPNLVSTIYPFPEPHIGQDNIKAIILGADPTHIVDGKPKPLKMVFGLEQNNSPYWRSITKNLEQFPNLGMDNIYVQNVCRNYFMKETSKNKKWIEIARNYWIDFLKNELDSKFSKDVPILMTTEFILHASLKNQSQKIKASDIYKDCIIIKKDENLFSRELMAFYRHHEYSLDKWMKYRKSIYQRVENSN